VYDRLGVVTNLEIRDEILPSLSVIRWAPSKWGEKSGRIGNRQGRGAQKLGESIGRGGSKLLSMGGTFRSNRNTGKS